MSGASSRFASGTTLAAVALISAGALAYEILLVRLLSISQWHHFAYMIISLALLGFGVSGTVLALVGERLVRRFVPVFGACAALFAIGAIGCFTLSQHVPFNALEIGWDPSQALWLAVMYLLLMIPFCFAASCIGLGLMKYRGDVSRIYAVDLLGAGAGGAGVVWSLFVLTPSETLRAVALTGSLAAAVVWCGGGRGRRRAIVAYLALTGALAWITPDAFTRPRMSEYKDLSLALQATGARVVETRSSPLSQLSVVENQRVPFRHAPGLSLVSTATVPPQVAVHTDGSSPSAITRFDGNRSSVDFVADLTSAAPYHVMRPERALVLGAGGGLDVLQAVYFGVPDIDAVEIDAALVDIVRDDYAEFSGRLYSRDDVHVHVTDAMTYLSRGNERYGLIQLALLDAFNASSSGVLSLAESNLYTVQSIDKLIGRLTADGVLGVTRWVKVPPRDGIKLFATVVSALRSRGIDDPGAHVLWIRGWSTSTLLVRARAWSTDEIDAARAFANTRSFDMAFYPDMPRTEANRFNVLDAPRFYDAAHALLGPDAAEFLVRYKFNVRPATNDRPYFFNFFRWSHLPEMLRLQSQGGVALLELGYLILVATLVQAVLIGAVLILVPLRALRSGAETTHRLRRLRVLVYFLTVGVGFMFVEIAFIQKLGLFLHHPLYAVSVVLTGFLISAGVGSRLSGNVVADISRAPLVWRPFMGIVVLGWFYLLVLPGLFEMAASLGEVLKVCLALLLIAPLGICMGMPFPLGLGALESATRGWLPWAWAVNGCASVVSAVLATLLAMHFGFSVVLGVALVVYGVAATLGPHGFVATHPRAA